jgi:sporulation protein YlmC with PRC-barrel domain
MLGTQHIERLEGLEVIDQDGDKIGTVDDIYVDDRSGAPEFAAVKSGLFGTKRRFVPIRSAEEIEDSLRVPYTKAQVSDAPTPGDGRSPLRGGGGAALSPLPPRREPRRRHPGRPRAHRP